MSKYAGDGADCVLCRQLGRYFHISDFILRNSLFDILRFLSFAMMSGYHAGNGIAFMILTGRAFMILTGRAGGLPQI